MCANNKRRLGCGLLGFFLCRKLGGLLISLQQLKMKVAELTQTRLTPF
jgi:hypothetical protein